MTFSERTQEDSDPPSVAANSKALRLTLIIGVLVPAVIGLVAVVLTLVWLPQVPDPVAIHWGVGGRPDGFAPRWAPAVLAIVAGVALPVAMGLSVVAVVRRERYSQSARWSVASTVWLAVLMGVVSAGSTFIQRGLPAATDAPSVLPLLLVGFVAATLLAVIAYKLMPDSATKTVQGHSVAPVPLEAGEAITWTSEAVGSRWLAAIALIGAGLAGGWGIFVGPRYLVFVAVLLILVPAMMGMFRVSVGAQGLRVRSALGWPARQFALAEIKSVSVVNVQPFAEWGGWGWRTSPSGTAVITRKGPGLQITRANGRVFIVTCEDAAMGAQVLTALVDRAKKENGVA